MRPWIKNLLIFVVGGIGGTGVGFAAGIFAYPYIFLADVTAMEEVVGRATKPVVARSTFIHSPLLRSWPRERSLYNHNRGV